MTYRFLPFSPWLTSAVLVLAVLAMAAATARAADAEPFDLISGAEAQRDAAEPAPPPRTRAMRPSAAAAAAPTIVVIAPAIAGSAVASPLRIEVAFKAPPDARIVPSTFRLLYGVLKIDLTERVNRRTTVRESGVVVEQARVPDGTHRLIVRVADDKGRFGEQEIVIHVATAR